MDAGSSTNMQQSVDNSKM